MVEKGAPPATVNDLRFSVMGSVQVRRDGHSLALGPQRQQAVLALLLAHAGQPLSPAEFVATLWPGEPPNYALNIAQRQIGVLRRILEPQLEARAESRWLKRDGAFYRFTGAPESLDIIQFRALADEARDRLRTLDSNEALEGYLQALALWRDHCGTGLDGLAKLHPAFVGIDNEVFTAAIEAADLALQTSAAQVIAPPLQRIADRSPLDERLASRLLLCLAATGRRAEALARFAMLRTRLSEELGVDPGPDLAEAHERILRDESPLLQSSTPNRGAAQLAGPAVGDVSPAQSPAALVAFVGRETEFRSIRKLVLGHLDAPKSALSIAIDGMPGVGKTAFAIHLAHHLKSYFTDGCIFIDLRGFDELGAAVPKPAAARVLLNGLGVHDSDIPSAYEARIGLLRTVAAKRRVLFVLDNARDYGHVADLLPGAPGSVTVVTSRTRLGGLVIAGAHAVSLGVMSPGEARETLVTRLPPDYRGAENDAIDELAEYCGRLPLALSIVAAKVAENPSFPLTAMVRELRELHGSLDSFASDETQMNLREIFRWSYASLDAETARLFRLLSLYDGSVISLPAAAGLAGIELKKARFHLDVLIRCRLLQEIAEDRYAFHDLLRAYSAELTGASESAEEVSAARDRLASRGVPVG